MARKRKSTAPRKMILIVTASKEAALFFSQMRKDCRYSNLTVQYAEGVDNDLEKLIAYTSRARSHGRYNTAWLVFGFEALGTNAEEVKRLLPVAKHKRVELAWCNPGISLWYLLHMNNPSAFVGESAVIDAALPRFINGYTAGPEYLLGEGLNLHLALYPNKAKAAINARSYNELAKAATGIEATNLVYLLNAITEVCGLADITHNQKTIGMKN
jgi:hypothetical protein